MTVNKKLDWKDHINKVESDMAVRNGVIYRLREHLPQRELIRLVDGFVLPKATYMLDVMCDSLGKEKGSMAVAKRLQVKSNDAIRSALRIGKEAHVGTHALSARTRLATIEERVLRADCGLAWRLFAPLGDMQDISQERLRMHAHSHTTRSVSKDILTQEEQFCSFLSKTATLYNVFPQELRLKNSKQAAKSYIKNHTESLLESIKNIPHLTEG